MSEPILNKAYFFIALNLDLAPSEKLLEHTRLAGIDTSDLDNIDLNDAIQVVRNLKKYSYTTNYAAIFGAHLGAASHGPVGYATLSAPTVGKALSTFAEWFHIRSDVYRAKVIETDDYFQIEITDTSGDSVFKEFFFEAFMRAFEVLIAYLMGHAHKHKTQLCFLTKAEDRQALMKEEYDSMLTFGADKNVLKIPKDIWYFVSPLYDKDSYDFNVRKCQQIMEQKDLAGRIDLKIRHLIRKHFEQSEIDRTIKAAPTQPHLCDVVFMSERTLIRHLKALNTSFKSILEEERRLSADKLLEQARYTICDISEILGYTESANFCRAFKRWHGLSPSEYRRQPLHQDNRAK